MKCPECEKKLNKLKAEGKYFCEHCEQIFHSKLTKKSKGKKKKGGFDTGKFIDGLIGNNNMF